MRHDEFSRSEIPSEGVQIGGDEDCPHETYRRFGSDGGGNIYFRCTNCEQVILNYDTTSGQRDDVDPDLTPSGSDGPKPDPLMKGLSVDDKEERRSKESRQTGMLARIRSDLDRLLPWRGD